ncbi:MAG: orotidine-5'-phosphate decarboxylase [Planctomycetes bacterium]|nr:orotidine-5'-phosphate decarboxylase [Planctomycetota bacterium]
MARDNFATRLNAAVRDYGPLCVGIDPFFPSLPPELRERVVTRTEEAAAVGIFADSIIDAVEGIVGVLKFQVGYFEKYGAAGYVELESAVRRARNAGFVVIADAKRGDIGSTMKAYADFYMEVLDVDAVTLNPYMGSDVVKPFLPYAERGKGAFLLSRTSNAAAAELQEVSAREGHPYYLYLTERVLSWQQDLEPDNDGYLPFGIVAGATAPEEMALLRSRFPQLPMLVPGFGFQGGSAEDTAPAFDGNGTGAVVNSSRGIIYAFAGDSVPRDWREAISDAARSAQVALKNAANAS